MKNNTTIDLSIDQKMLEKRSQQNINLTYKTAMGILSIVVIISPMACIAAGAATNAALIIVKGAQYLDKKTNYEFSQWLAGLMERIKEKTSNSEEIPVIYTKINELNNRLQEKKYYSTLLHSSSSDDLPIKIPNSFAGNKLPLSKSESTLFAQPKLPSKREPKEALDRLVKSWRA